MGLRRSSRYDEGFLLRGITGKQLNYIMDPAQICPVLRFLAAKAELNSLAIAVQSARIGPPNDFLNIDRGIS